jgi:hypothetical protein
MSVRAVLRWALRQVALAAVVLIASGHVGSPDAWYDGPAGPYRVLVHVETPVVIPGIAGVNVRVADDGVDQVTAFVNRFDATGGAPPPEVATPVEGRPGWYRTNLWVMTSGSNSVTVGVSGSKGHGRAVVPVVAVPIRRLEFSRGRGVILGLLGLVLVAGIVTIIGAAVREGVLPPGDEPGPDRARLGARAMVAAAAVVTLLLFGGWRWWGAEDAGFVRSMFRPMASEATITDSGGVLRLVLAVSDSAWIMRDDPTWLRIRGATRRTPLIADHGKVMHLFLIGDADPRAFAHLHPSTRDSVRFITPLPPVPAGRYRVFGDIVHESGLTQTLVAEVGVSESIPGEAAAPSGDPDDAWSVERPALLESRALADGSTITWLGADSTLIAGEDANLRFVIADPEGVRAPLEPYMGMPGHTVVMRDDGSVFVHLHPSGTISMAAQRSLELRESGDTVPGSLARRLSTRVDSLIGHAGSAHRGPNAVPGSAAADTLVFPYAFPEPGRYFVWIQVKRNGRVLTAGFAATVQETR